MKHPQFLLIGAIAFGAIVGPVLATTTYLQTRAPQTVPPIATPVVSTPAPEALPVSNPVAIPERSRPVSEGQPANPAPIQPEVESSVEPSVEPSVVAQTPPRPASGNTGTTRPPQPNASEFSQFRLRLLDAIARRDARFINSLVTAETQFSFGGSIELETYQINNPNAKFWQDLEKAVSVGCTADPETRVTNREPGTTVWACPATPGKPIYQFGWNERVAILGQNVNVRAGFGTGTAVVTTVSNQLVTFDQAAFQNLPQNLQTAVYTSGGWTPVVLSNGQRGFVQNRYAYYEPRDYRVSFVRSRGQWRLNYFLSGDGN